LATRTFLNHLLYINVYQQGKPTSFGSWGLPFATDQNQATLREQFGSERGSTSPQESLQQVDVIHSGLFFFGGRHAMKVGSSS
jgi:hypothetical protein